MCLHDVIETKDLRKEDVPALRDSAFTRLSDTRRGASAFLEGHK